MKTKKMEINLNILGYSFVNKPLLIGGMAMEYYQIRKAGADIDFVISELDHGQLIKKFPDKCRDVHGDIGVCVNNFELWNTICKFDYEYLKENAIEEDELLIASLEKLLFLKAMAMENVKYLNDLKLIVKVIWNQQYRSFRFD